MTVPDDLPENFYTLVGKVALAATDLEAALADIVLLISVGRPPDEEFNDEYTNQFQKCFSTQGSNLIKELDKRVAANFPERDDFALYLEACNTALEDRNGIVHSIWFALDADSWVASRSIRISKAAPDRPSARGIKANEQWLHQRLARLIELRRQASVWRERIDSSLQA